MADLFFSLSFWNSPLALGLAFVSASLVFLAWNWRFTLPALFLAQWFAGALVVHSHGLPPQWLFVYLGALGLACLILAVTALQVGPRMYRRSSTNFPFRLLLLLLVYLLIRWGEVGLSLPLLADETTDLFLWFALCALLTLSVAGDPLHTAVGLLLWLVPLNSLAALAIPQPALIVGLSSLGILIAFVSGYFMLAESDLLAEQVRSPTDSTFPFKAGNEPPITDALGLLGRLWRRHSLTPPSRGRR